MKNTRSISAFSAALAIAVGFAFAAPAHAADSARTAAVVLSGCGGMDGAELTEAVSMLIALDEAGFRVQAYAPDMEAPVINHRTLQPTDEKRNVLDEAARLVRGQILPLADYRPEQADALILIGGFGNVRNLCDYLTAGDACTVRPDIETALRTTREANKPIGAMCISPLVLAKVLPGITITLGNPPENIAISVEEFGATNQIAGPTDICIDAANRIITTPAYMVETSPAKVAEGAKNLVRALQPLLTP